MEYPSLQSVTRIPLNEKVYRVVMNSIIDGSLPPGTELREQHIAKQIGVSATPVREAFKRLASDGLIDIVPYRGAVVRAMNYQEIEEAYLCREALEHLVLKQGIDRITPRDIVTLHSLLDEYLIATGVERISSLSEQFDDVIYDLARNHTLSGMLLNLRSITNRDRKFASSDELRRAAIYQEHLQITNALQVHDLAGAQLAVSVHLKNGLNHIGKADKVT